MSHWRVNSYGYPNPFSSDKDAQKAWQILLSFYDCTSYSEVKRYWESPSAPFSLSKNSVESRKASFEEFGLLYVLSGSNSIHITPAGHQLRAAVEGARQQEFAWIGLSLLLRYPLRGPRPQRWRSVAPEQERSDLLLYWFIYAAMRELSNYLWWSELARVLCMVFRVADAAQAIDTIRELRSGRRPLETLRSPAVDQQGQDRASLYNVLNQVMVHTGLDYMLLDKDTNEGLYPGDRTRFTIRNEWLPLIDRALGDTVDGVECNNQTQFISRMPIAPSFEGDEQAYFDYLGAPVSLDATSTREYGTTTLGGGTVSLLRAGIHFTRRSAQEITGSISQLCRLAREQRVVVSDELSYTYIVENKRRSDSNEIIVTLRRARRITDQAYVRSLLEENRE